MTDATINQDAAHQHDEQSSMTAAQQLLLSRWGADENPSPETDREERADHEEDDAHDQPDNSNEPTLEYEETEDAREADTDKQPRTRRIAADEDEVEVTVDGNTKKLSVKDLRRLAGQEQALQQKSQAAAELRKQAEQKQNFLESKLTALIEEAHRDWEEYKDIDPNLFLQTHGEQTYRYLKAERERRENKLRTLMESANDFANRVQNEKQRVRQSQATETRRVLEERIPGFNREALEKLADYAMKSGISAERVNSTLDPNEIIAWNKARLYDEMTSKAAEVTRKPTEPAKVLKPATPAPVKRDRVDDAMRDLQRTGSKAAAEKVLMARFKR